MDNAELRRQTAETARAKARELVSLILALPEELRAYAWSEAHETFDEGLDLCYDCFMMNCTGYCRYDSYPTGC